MSSRNLTLLLFTSWFPFGHGESFLETEIHYLAERFERIVIVPSQIDENIRPLPENVQVETSFVKNRPRITRPLLARVAAQNIPALAREAADRLPTLLKREPLRRALYDLTEANYLSAWLAGYLAQEGRTPANTLLYTYWFTSSALAIHLLKAKMREWTLVSRAHRGDIYEEVYSPPYLPFRRASLMELDLLAVVSEHGRRYILERYPYFTGLCEVHRLGVNDPGFRNTVTESSRFRIVTCSAMIPVKRLSLLIASLASLARMLPDTIVEWHHIGDGALWETIEREAATALPETIRCRFHGQLKNREVVEYYRHNPVNLFANVSQSEGIPVSIMEAQSCGIPVMAPAVGGVPEIVNDENGFLLNPNATPDEIASVIRGAIENPSHLLSLREKSRENWYHRFNAQLNYRIFADRLFELMNKAPVQT